MSADTVVRKYEDAILTSARGGEIDKNVVLGLVRALGRWESHTLKLAGKAALTVGNPEDYDPEGDFADTFAKTSRRAGRDWERYAP